MARKLKEIFNSADMPNNEPCIYCLYSSGVCVYVGQTTCFYARIMSHLSSGKEFDSFTFEYHKGGSINDAEAKKIVEMQPTLNKELPVNKFYTPLRTISDTIRNMVLDEDAPCDFSAAKGNSDKLTRRYISSDDAQEIINIVASKLNLIKKIKLKPIKETNNELEIKTSN